MVSMRKLFGGLRVRPASLVVLLILAATFLAYGGALNNGFLLDDDDLILNNPLLAKPFCLTEFLSCPFLGGYYRPVPLFSIIIDHRLWGFSSAGFHLTGILAHFANALLVFFFLRRLLGDRLRALIAGLLFAVHPIATQPVNNLSDRGNLFLVFFVLLALLCLLHTRKSPRPLAFFFLSFLFFLLGLASRENGLFFPLYAGLCLFIDGPKIRRRESLFLGLGAAASLLFFLVRSRFFLFFAGTSHMPLTWDSLSAFSFFIIRFIRQIVWPPYTLWIDSAPPGAVGSPFFPALLCALVLTASWGARRHRVLRFAALWFLFAVLPLYAFMHVRPEEGLVMQDNQIYLGLVAPFSLMAGGLIRLKGLMHGKIWGTLVAAVLLAYASQAQAFSLAYRDNRALLDHWVRHSPESKIAALNLAGLYLEDNDLDTALAMYKKSLSGLSRGHDAIALVNMGYIFIAKGQYAMAESCLEEARRLAPGMWQAYFQLSRLAERRGDTAAAASWLQQALTLNPNM